MIHVFIGTKAQYVKMAPLLLRMDRTGVDYRLIDSGQHAELAGSLRHEFGLRTPDFSLGGNRDVTSIPQALLWFLTIARRLGSRSRLRREVFGGNDGICAVHGDTPTTLLSTLLARRAGLAVAHVEAGLRTHRWLHPFPEEMVRTAVGRLADVLFAPDATAAANLRRSGVKGRIVEQPGNTLVESLRSALGGALMEKSNDASVAAGREATARRPEVAVACGARSSAAPAVVTMHRVENLHHRLRRESLIGLVETLAGRMPVCWVLHGPTERAVSKEAQRRLVATGVRLIPLLPHAEFLTMLADAPLVITDGGSIQEECAILGVPTLLWRGHTDRADGLGANVVLSQFDPSVVEEFLTDPQKHRRPVSIPEFSPSEQILAELAAWR